MENITKKCYIAILVHKSHLCVWSRMLQIKVWVTTPGISTFGLRHDVKHKGQCFLRVHFRVSVLVFVFSFEFVSVLTSYVKDTKQNSFTYKEDEILIF